MHLPLRKILIPAGFFLCGLIASLALLEITLRVAAHLYAGSAGVAVPDGVQDDARVTVACFGDSFTEGGYSLNKDRYPAQLQRMFDAAGGKVRVINYGVCESNSTQLYRRLVQAAETRRFDYVVLLTGSTNRYNFVGFNDSPLTYFLKTLRISRLAHVFGIYVRDRIVRVRAQRLSLEPDVPATDLGPTVDDVRRMASRDPRNGYMLWVRYCISQGRYADALHVLQREASRDNRGPEISLAMGECFEGLDDHAAAERMYRAAAKRSPAPGHLALGRYYKRRGNAGMAEQAFRESVRHGAAEGHLELGLLLRDRKKYAAAEEAFKRALAHAPLQAERNLINLYAERGRYEEAEARYADALGRHRGRHLMDFVVSYYVPRGKYADAIRCFLLALERQSPPDIGPIVLISSMYMLQSQYTTKDVLGAMERAIARTPSLARDPLFRAYVEFFRDVDGWEEKRRTWLQNDLEAIAAFCRLRGMRLIVMNYPMSFSAANDLLQALAQRRGLPFIDLQARFSELGARDGRGKYLLENELHCTPEGHRVMAESVFHMVGSLMGEGPGAAVTTTRR